MKKIFLSALFLASLTHGVVSAQTEVRFHNEETDTTKITSLLIDAIKIKDPQQRVASVARHFIGTPYVAHTLEGETEALTVNLDELDCTTFVETAMTLAFTAGEQRSSWRDYLYNLERLRYRDGKLDGYPSRLHYISNWIVDNVHRGNFEEATIRFPRYNYLERTISFMTENRDKYKALSDSVNFEKMRNIELGYSNHRFPYIKTIDLGRKETKAALREGDVVALVSNLKNLDVTHMGIIIKENGEPYLLHASSTGRKVEISALPLAEFMKKNRSFLGIRVIRIKD